MRRLLTASALVALAVFVTDASGQPQPLQPPIAAQPLPVPPKVEKKTDPADAAIAAALANDPDVKMAKAKIQLAEAELAKARLAATQKVFAAKSAAQDAQLAVVMAEQGLASLVQSYKVERVTNYETRPEYRLALLKVEAAKAKLATAEAELKLLTGGAADKTAVSFAEAIDLAGERHHFYQAVLAISRKAPDGAIPDRIRAALDKPVKLGAKGAEVSFAQALEVFKKDAGLGVPVRGTSGLFTITSQGEELPVVAWLQLFGDDNSGEFYVREYGLMFTNKKSAPPDAPTVIEFWKQKPAAKPEKADPKPKP